MSRNLFVEFYGQFSELGILCQKASWDAVKERRMAYFVGTVAGVVIFILGVLAGNQSGDQATLRDCATKGVAKMAGGGSVKCEVVKEEAK